MKQCKIFYPHYRPYYLVLSYLSLLLYGFYLDGSWWISLCAIVIGFIQLWAISFTFIGTGNSEYTYELINPNDFPEIIKKHERIYWFYIINAVIISILDLFPLFAMSESLMDNLGLYCCAYEGGFVTTAVILLTVFLNMVFPICSNRVRLIKGDYESYKEKGKTACDQDDERFEIEKRAKEQQKRELLDFINKRPSTLGNNYKEVKYFEANHNKMYSFIVSEEKQLLEINYKIYNFKDVLDFKVVDNEEVVYTPAQYSTTTNTGSMIGRAIVGGLVSGGVGAIIGGATASKETVQTVNSSSITHHDFKIILYLNKLHNSKEELAIGDDVNKTQEISSLLTYVLNKKISSQTDKKEKNNPSANTSIADELLKLANLKEKGILTEEEFNAQKQKLLGL